MCCQSMFHTLLIIMLSMLLHGCGSFPVKCVQTYPGEMLEESEMSWVRIGSIWDQDNMSFPIGELQVKIDSFPQETFISREPRHTYIFAFPSGEQTIQVRFYWQSHRARHYTDWVKLTNFLRGGKCYVIDDYVVDDSLISMPSRHEFLFKETSCGTWFSKGSYNRVELYKPGGPDATSPLQLIRSYDLDDEVFSDPRLHDSKNRIAILSEYIRRLFKESE